MMIEEPQQFTVADEEETLVTPRFDDEETIVARRVVPLDAIEEGAHEAPPDAAPVHTQPPRRPRVLALALASALVGSVLGGAGLYFYQSRSSSNLSPAATVPERADAPAQVAQPAPAAQSAGDPAASAEQHDAAADESGPQGADGSKVEDSAGAKEAGQSPDADVRDVSGEDAPVGALKRGKKGEHDEEARRLGRRVQRADSERETSPSETDATDAASGDRHARRVDTIFSRPRRASERDHARRERPHSVDSIRGIFEGQP